MNNINQIYDLRDSQNPRKLINSLNIYNLFVYSVEIKKFFERSSIPITEALLLDYGCGVGARLLEIYRLGATFSNLYGFDCNPSRINIAKKIFESTNIMHGENSYSISPKQFDVLMNSTMMSSILDDKQASKIANEFYRLTKDSGFIIWYDLCLKNPYNPNVRSYKIKDILKLFPNHKIIYRKKICLPPVSGLKELPFPLLRTIHTIPLLRSHYFIVLKHV